MPPHDERIRVPEAKPGSQSALRQSNQQRIIAALLASGSDTQAGLARQTGLSTATVSNIVRVLSDKGLVTTEQVTSSGRRALSVSLAGRGAVAVGMDFGRTHTRVIVSSLDYQLIEERVIESPLGQSFQLGLDAAATLLATMLAEVGLPRSAVIGVGVGIPGSIDARTGQIAEGNVLPEWAGASREALEKRLKVPVYLDNDANLGALAEVTWGPHAGTSNLVFVKIATGIGAGLIINGVQFRGSIGVTGEIGHTQILDHGLLCRCGNRGCLETVASTAMMLEVLSRSPGRASTAADIVERALDNDRAVLHVLEDAGIAIGRSLANIANFLNPETIVIGGPLADTGELLLGPIRRGLRRFSLPVLQDATTLVMSSLGDKAEALGAAALVLHQPESHSFAMGSLSALALTS
ncbi:MAG: ArsR family transcriptional regulator [Frankiales bacterium]|nr:ArsR family transcriptional regulator [Frankiales bacterium]